MPQNDDTKARLVEVNYVDQINKRILFELDLNSRLSYQELGDKIGISANAVKKRVAALIETGVIYEFVVQLKHRMAGASWVITVITTDGNEDVSAFYDEINKHPAVTGIFPQVTKSYVLFSQCIGIQQVNELSIHLRSIKHVADTEMHIIGKDPLSEGKVARLDRLQLRVLEALLDDARMPLVEISRTTGLSARRVRKVLDQLAENDNVHFAVYWNVNLGEGNFFLSRIQFDVRETSSTEVETEFNDQYPLEYWYSYVSATEPVMFSVFVVPHIREAREIEEYLKKLSGVQSVKNMVLYPAHIFKYPMQDALRKIIAERLHGK